MLLPELPVMAFGVFFEEVFTAFPVEYSLQVFNQRDQERDIVFAQAEVDFLISALY